MSLINRNVQLFLALALALTYHGGLLISGSFKRSYDSFVHIFFADHYARNWFDHWDTRWYTGFTLTSYPPASQQSIAAISPITGLINGYILVMVAAVLLIVIGVYRFSRLWVSEEAARYAALLAVFASSIAETLHVFGQLPTLFALGFLLNSLPYIWNWLDKGDWRNLAIAWILGAAVSAGHHVTTIFGAIFFIGPVIAAVIASHWIRPRSDEILTDPVRITNASFRPLFFRQLRRIWGVLARAALFGFGLIALLLVILLPYWLWTISDPLVQVPIPHGSRDSFFEKFDSALIFWIVPYGITILALPYIFYKSFQRRTWFLGLSIAVLFLLGTGGTTPLPRLLLGGAYEVLTLERFTFWATILMLPLLGEFVVSLESGQTARIIRGQFGVVAQRGLQIVLVLGYLVCSMLSSNLGQFRRLQPEPIEMQPLTSFLERDEHYRWRYITLGFGDQMAWLAAQTTATTVDGNYHSARRLPELTSAPVERLEGAKFRDIGGIGALQQFLTLPEKYNLKFVFSNDQFYDPLLYFAGWQRTQRLENNIVVWERADVPPLADQLPRTEIPVYQRIMWGILPLSAVGLALLALAGAWLGLRVPNLYGLSGLGSPFRRASSWIDRRLLLASQMPIPLPVNPAPRPKQPAAALKPASVTLQTIRTGLVVLVVGGAIGAGVYAWLQPPGEPLAVVQAYYNDLDFRRFKAAYERLDPAQRPTYEQYRADLTLKNGLVSSYSKLDTVESRILESQPDRLLVESNTRWTTSLEKYPVTERHNLIRRNGQWYLVPAPPDNTLVNQQFIRRNEINWFLPARNPEPNGEIKNLTRLFDRPRLQVISARLVKSNERFSIVGELINNDVDPADVTLNGALINPDDNFLASNNASVNLVHKLFPKESTPFRIDFAGVSTKPIDRNTTVTGFQVEVRAVIASRELSRDVAIQQIKLENRPEQPAQLSGELLNLGTQEATVPQVLVTYYDNNQQVMWVDSFFQSEAVLPQRTRSFAMPLKAANQVETVFEQGKIFVNGLEASSAGAVAERERITLAAGSGYSAIRLSLNYFRGSGI